MSLQDDDHTVLFIHVINVYKRYLFLKKFKHVLMFFILLTFFFYFHLVKIIQITFPGCSNIGNVLTIKDNGI